MKKSRKRLIEKLKKFRKSERLQSQLRRRAIKKRKEKGNESSFRIKLIISSLIQGKFLLTILLFILLVFLSFVGFSFYKLQNLSAFNNPTNWNKDSRLNFVILGIDKKESNYKFVDAIVVISISTKQNGASIFAIDPDIRVLNEEGDYIELRKLYNIRVNGQNGVWNVIDEIEDLVALNITKYIEVDKDDFIDLQPIFGGLNLSLQEDVQDRDIVSTSGKFFISKGERELSGLEAYNILRINDNGADMRLSFQAEGLKNYIIKLESLNVLFKILFYLEKFDGLETNFSRREVLSLVLFLRNLNFDNIRYGFTKSTSLKYDEYNNKYPKIESIDKDLETVFVDYSLIREQARLEILNGTKQSGLAGKYSRYFSNLGVRVVRTGNSLQPADRTILFTQNTSLYPETLEYIKSVFNDRVEVVEQDYKYKHIGDIVLVLGNDIEDNS